MPSMSGRYAVLPPVLPGAAVVAVKGESDGPGGGRSGAHADERVTDLVGNESGDVPAEARDLLDQ